MEHYEPVSFPLETPLPEFVEALPELLARELGEGSIRSLADPDGNVGPDAIAALPDEARYGLYSTTRRWARGAELDLLVDTGAGPKPVTVWWSPRGDARVAWSDAEPARATRPAGVEGASWGRHVAALHGTGGFGGERPWSEVEVGDVALALELVSAEERAALAGVAFERVAVSPRSAARELAFFDPTVEPPRLSFYDGAFEADRTGFVGPVDAPIAAGAMTALHEFGHVLADLPLREAVEAWEAAWRAARAEAIVARRGDAWRAEHTAAAARRAVGRKGPVIEAWERFRSGRPGPSTAGFGSADESFAEAFALYHLDPAALERALPGAVAWFASGAHLRSARGDPSP